MVGQGHLLYPAQDGNTFVYEMAGRLIYRRKKTDVTPRQGWFFAFDPAEERIWLECTAGIEQIEEKPTENTWFLIWKAGKKGWKPPPDQLYFPDGYARKTHSSKRFCSRVQNRPSDGSAAAKEK